MVNAATVFRPGRGLATASSSRPREVTSPVWFCSAGTMPGTVVGTFCRFRSNTATLKWPLKPAGWYFKPISACSPVSGRKSWFEALRPMIGL